MLPILQSVQQVACPTPCPTIQPTHTLRPIREAVLAIISQIWVPGVGLVMQVILECMAKHLR